MLLTVLGKYGPYPPAGGATSGYLLQSGGAKLLLECGSGVLSRLQTYITLPEISAIIISHLHSDHVADMFILNYALQQLKARGDVTAPLRVFLPDQPSRESAFIRSMNSFEFITLSDGLRVRLGKNELEFFGVQHPFPSYGMKLRCDGKTLIYTGDTRYFDGIEQLTQNADVLLADSGLLSREKTAPLAPHLTAAECGSLAENAGAKRLLLTHISPRASEAEVLGEARRYFAAAELVSENAQYEI